MDKRKSHVRRPRQAMEDAMLTTGEKLTPAQIKTLKKKFKALDLNHDGRISSTDLKRACKQLGILLTQDELADMMKEGDDDGNGFIEYAEFEKLIGHQLVIANYKNKCLREQFEVFDKNGDGYITADEIRQVFQATGAAFTEEEITELVDEADENKDGVISFEEFVSTVCEKDW